MFSLVGSVIKLILNSIKKTNKLHKLPAEGNVERDLISHFPGGSPLTMKEEGAKENWKKKTTTLPVESGTSYGF